MKISFYSYSLGWIFKLTYFNSLNRIFPFFLNVSCMVTRETKLLLLYKKNKSWPLVVTRLYLLFNGHYLTILLLFLSRKYPYFISIESIYLFPTKAGWRGMLGSRSLFPWKVAVLSHLKITQYRYSRVSFKLTTMRDEPPSHTHHLIGTRCGMGDWWLVYHCS